MSHAAEGDWCILIENQELQDETPHVTFERGTIFDQGMTTGSYSSDGEAVTASLDEGTRLQLVFQGRDAMTGDITSTVAQTNDLRQPVTLRRRAAA